MREVELARQLADGEGGPPAWATLGRQRLRAWRLHWSIDVYVKCKRSPRPHESRTKPNCTTRFGDTLPAPGTHARGGAGRALAAHGAAVRAGPHQPVAAARPRRATAARAGPSSTAASPTTPPAPPGSRCSRHELRRPAGAARDRHPHAPRPHRPGALADRTLEHAGDAGCGSAPPTTTPRAWPASATTGFGGDSAARFFARHGLTDPDALDKVRARTQLLREHGAAGAGALPAPDGRRRAAHRRRTTGAAIAGYGHAPEHIALHCAGAGRADLAATWCCRASPPTSA